MDIELLLGTWRTTKIQWHEGNITTYDEQSQWRQLTFEPGGVMSEFENYQGKLMRFLNMANWRVEKKEVIINEYRIKESHVLELTGDSMIIKSDNTGIKYYLKRV